MVFGDLVFFEEIEFFAIGPEDVELAIVGQTKNVSRERNELGVFTGAGSAFPEDLAGGWLETRNAASFELAEPV